MGRIYSYTEKTTPAGTDEFIFQETSNGITKKITHTNFLKVIQAEVDDLQANPTASRGYLSGYEIANNSTDSEHDIDISVGIARNDDNDGDIVLATALTKQIDAAWSAGTNAGGLDTGTVAADTWYYPWAIYNPTTFTEDALLSLSQTSPTLPSGYTKKRRIRGAVLTDGSANIIPFHQNENFFFYNDRIVDLNTTTMGTTRQLLTVSVPPGWVGIFHYLIVEGDTTYIWFDSVNKTDAAASASNSDVRAPSTNGFDKFIAVDSSSQIAYRSDRSAVSVSVLATHGFIDKAEV
jgi:hypothetical protein